MIDWVAMICIVLSAFLGLWKALPKGRGIRY